MLNVDERDAGEGVSLRPLNFPLCGRLTADASSPEHFCCEKVRLGRGFLPSEDGEGFTKGVKGELHVAELVEFLTVALKQPSVPLAICQLVN